MNLQDSVNMLANYEAFAIYLRNVKQMREQAIADMHNVNTDALQQISGRILAYNDILSMSESDRVFRIHKDNP
jgi:hypothetical protein